MTLASKNSMINISFLPEDILKENLLTKFQNAIRNDRMDLIFNYYSFSHPVPTDSRY